MQTIYINQRPLVFAAKPTLPTENDTLHLKTTFSCEVGQLAHYATLLEAADCPYTAITVIGNVDEMMVAFASLYRNQAAAGGVVRNLEGNVLLIFRRGFWDLPKGKIDEGEMSEQAALREVGEEVGLTECDILRPLTITYHTFTDKKGRKILKPTYWYLMETPTDVVTLQTEEDIEASVWTSPQAFLQNGEPIYPNIVNVLKML
jgi:8-oxo-dGTP pyrophosphatase MutT (NUDIX family)